MYGEYDETDLSGRWLWLARFLTLLITGWLATIMLAGALINRLFRFIWRH